MIKNVFTIALVSALVISCKDDEKCTPPPLEKQIVGTWIATLLSEESRHQEMVFENDGQLKESKAFLFGAYNKPIIKWDVKNNEISLSAKFEDGSVEVYECSVVTRSCEEIVFDLQGIDQLKLTKK